MKKYVKPAMRKFPALKPRIYRPRFRVPWMQGKLRPDSLKLKK